MLHGLRHEKSHRIEELAACFVVSREMLCLWRTVTDGTDLSSEARLS
jgi:hypothetical protein